MELHHSKHHAGYVTKANATLERLGEARAKEGLRPRRGSRARACVQRVGARAAQRVLAEFGPGHGW
jgi:superoxide dismutase